MERIIANGDIMVESAETGSPEPSASRWPRSGGDFSLSTYSLPITLSPVVAITETVFELLFATQTLLPPRVASHFEKYFGPDDPLGLILADEFGAHRDTDLATAAMIMGSLRSSAPIVGVLGGG
jgi:hypothetical protein